MDKKMLTIVLSIVLIGCFFLPYFKLFGGSASGYDIVFSGGGNWEKYLLLLIPIPAVLLLVGALNNGNYIGGRTLWAWLPLLCILYHLIRMIVEGAAIGDLVKIIGIGLWVSLAAALVLAFYDPKKA